MPSPGLKHATRHYLLRFWSSIVEMSGGQPVTGSSAPLEPQATESYLKPPDEFDEFDDHRSVQQSRRGNVEFEPTRDRGMLRHGKSTVIYNFL